ncbi:Ras family GTPase [uncultured virus]|nr:Ras family GTPase [uncultured virus]
MNNIDFIIKVIIIGDSIIGKTSIGEKYVNNKFNDTNPISTIGVDFFSKIIKFQNKNIKLQIWDTAGQERFRSITKSYYRDCTGIFLCFSLINKMSFLNLKKYINDINQICLYNPKIILVGTFLDKLDEYNGFEKEVNNFIEENKFIYIEVSSKTGENIDELFKKMIELIMVNIDLKKMNRSNNKIIKKKNLCCKIV